MVQGLRLCAPNAGDLDQGARSHTQQLRVCMPLAKDPACRNEDQSSFVATKTRHSQINKKQVVKSEGVGREVVC